MFSNSGFDQSLSNINNNNNNYVTDIYVFMFIPQNNLFDNNCIYIYRHRHTRLGGMGAASPQKNLKLKSLANFEHKLGKNLRNKASIRKQL